MNKDLLKHENNYKYILVLFEGRLALLRKMLPQITLGQSPCAGNEARLYSSQTRRLGLARTYRASQELAPLCLISSTPLHT